MQRDGRRWPDGVSLTKSGFDGGGLMAAQSCREAAQSWTRLATHVSPRMSLHARVCVAIRVLLAARSGSAPHTRLDTHAASSPVACTLQHARRLRACPTITASHGCCPVACPEPRHAPQLLPRRPPAALSFAAAAAGVPSHHHLRFLAVRELQVRVGLRWAELHADPHVERERRQLLRRL